MVQQIGVGPSLSVLLFELFVALDSSSLSRYDRLLLKSMFSLAFYFGLRVGEITVSPHNIKYSQISFSFGKLLVSFSSYKHSPLHPWPHSIRVSKSTICPVLALKKYISCRGRRAGVLFLRHDKPVSRSFFSSQLTSLISSVGEDPTGFSSHSFRIGAATYWAGKQI